MKVKVPKHEDVKECKIGLYDENELIGEIIMNVSEIFANEAGKESKYAENTEINNEQTATLKYSIIRGENGHFEKKDWMGSKIVTKKDEPKIQEPKKEEPKKEEPKKEEPKKEELKKEEPKKDEPKKEEPKKE